MKSIQVYTSITEGLLLASSSYKNGFINKSTYNECMLNSLSFLLNIIGKINNEITKEKKENNSLINKIQAFSNPMIDIVLPMSSISYTMELQINNQPSKNKYKSKNKKFLFNENNNKCKITNSNNNINSLFEIQFEQTPLHSLAQTTPFNNSNLKINVFDFDNDEIFDTFFIPFPAFNRNKRTNSNNKDYNKFNSETSLTYNNGTDPNNFLSEELINAKVLSKDYNFDKYKEFVPMQPGDVPVTYADTRELEEDFGFKPNTSLREGLRKFSMWYYDFYMEKN